MARRSGAPMTGRLLLAAALCAVAAGQMPGKKEKVLPVMADVKHIDCAVCGEVAKVVHRAVSAMRKELAAGKKLKEEAIIDKLETVCDPEDELGDWITHFDIVQEDEKLLLKDMGATGDCHRECRTIARACDNVFNDHDTDIAEALYKEEHMKRAELQQLLCYDLQRVCPEKKTAIKGSRPHDEVWAEVDPEKLKIQKMMKEMEAAGAPGMSMYSRDEMMQQMEAYQDDYEADADYAPPDSIRDEDLPDSDDYDGGEDYGEPGTTYAAHDLSFADIATAAAEKVAASVSKTLNTAWVGAMHLTDKVKRMITKTDTDAEL
mmetsp:Transcript_39382/g.100624  ORF Transcript_39382/g.100624 Transcript_39382/m.100624 type:complete len:319 (+) Transcript_39382:96-1052(+)